MTAAAPATERRPRGVVLPEHLRMSSDLLVLERTPIGTPAFEERLSEIEEIVLAIRHHHDEARAASAQPGAARP